MSFYFFPWVFIFEFFPLDLISQWRDFKPSFERNYQFQWFLNRPFSTVFLQNQGELNSRFSKLNHILNLNSKIRNFFDFRAKIASFPIICPQNCLLDSQNFLNSRIFFLNFRICQIDDQKTVKKSPSRSHFFWKTQSLKNTKRAPNT